MPQLLDDLLGAAPVSPLSRSGPATARVSAAARSAEVDPDTFLAAAIWWIFSRTPTYERLLAASEVAPDHDAIVVMHARRTRFNLLLLDPTHTGVPTATRLDRRQLVGALIEAQQLLARIDFLRRCGLERLTESPDLPRSMLEVASRHDFGIARAASPDLMTQSCVSPAPRVRNGHSEATVGAVLYAPPHGWVGTTAAHSISPDALTVRVDDRVCEVIARHEPSDSCLIRLDEDPATGRPRQGRQGPRRGRPPATLTPAVFHGLRPEPVTTVVSGFDLTIVDPSPDEICRIYTSADTIPGDSGCALIGEGDQIIGFAHKRSRYDATPTFSSWVWAELVYMVHGLFAAQDFAEDS